MWKIKLRSVPDSSIAEDLFPFSQPGAQPGDASLRTEHGALPTRAASFSPFVSSSALPVLLLRSNFTFLLASPVKLS